MRFDVKKLEEIRVVTELSVHDFSKLIGVSRQKYYDLIASADEPLYAMNFSTATKIARRLRMPEKSLLIFDR